LARDDVRLGVDGRGCILTLAAVTCRVVVLRVRGIDGFWMMYFVVRLPGLSLCRDRLEGVEVFCCFLRVCEGQGSADERSKRVRGSISEVCGLQPESAEYGRGVFVVWVMFCGEWTGSRCRNCP